MIALRESIYSNESIESVFNYVSDFGHIQEWDPGVLCSTRTLPGNTGIGSAYDLTLKFGPFRSKMRYIIDVYEPFSKVVLRGAGESFNAVDTICFKETDTGTRIDYQADIRFSGLGRYLEAILAPVLKTYGKEAMSGLERALAERNGPVNKKGWVRSGASLPDFLADHAIVPGMLMFSRYGYAFSRRFWTGPAPTLYGKNVVITGGTSGIGKAAAFKLAEKNAFLTIIARNHEKARQVRQEIITKTGNPNVDFLLADLSLMRDINAVAGKLQASKKSIDILINNAGALFNERRTTSEGIEQTFATDLLGVFCLTIGLKKALARANNSRVVNVSSGGMYTQKIDVDDLENRFEPYNGAKAYARAKRGVVILTELWAEQFKKYGITVNAMHPGWVDTPGIEKSLPGFHQLVNTILRTPDQGADTIVWLAASRQAGQHTGRFWLDRRPHETVVLPGTGQTPRERRILWERLNGYSARVI